MFNILKSKPKENLTFEDDFDGKYKYKQFSTLSIIIMKVFNIKNWRPDRRKKAFGRISGNVFRYVTVPMLFVFGMVTWAVIAAFQNLIPYYETNVVLNGIIISFMIFGILKSFHNSYLLYKTALFLRLLEDVSRKDNIVMEDIYSLRRALERNGKLVNTVAMVETIDNIEKFGHPNFNDNRARLIKSKLGFRVSKNKANASYISGILVMLGLLGTFLGLLATIDSVGDALAGMSNIGGESGDVGVEEMSQFIGSLAKPLDGMGLAFSSSLFGLSGSLLIGFFLYLGGTPQNAFMENVGRWIDDRIPGFNPDKTAQKGTASAPAKEGDLKDWLAGFIHMSVKTNRSVSNLCQEIARSTEETQKIWEGTEAVHKTQRELLDSSHDTNQHLQEIGNHNALVSETMPKILSAVSTTLNNVTVLSDNSKVVANTLPIITKNMGDILTRVSAMDKGLSAVSTSASEMAQGIENMSTNTSMLRHQMERSAEIEKSALEARANLDQRNTEVLNLIKEVAESSYQMQLNSFDANAQGSKQIAKILGATQESISQILINLQQMVGLADHEKNEEHLKAIEGNLIEMNTSHKDVSVELKALLERLDSDPYVKRTETLVQRLDSIISDLNAKLKEFMSK
jgi:hypothetical protein